MSINFLLINNASPVAVSLDSTTAGARGVISALKNIGAGLATLTPTSGTIDGVASITVATGFGIWLFFDGTNWTSSPLSGASLNVADAEVPSGSINGSNTAFTIAHTPSPTSSLVGELNGQRIYQTSDFTVSGASITMLGAPATGDSLRFNYRY